MLDGSPCTPTPPAPPANPGPAAEPVKMRPAAPGEQALIDGLNRILGKSRRGRVAATNETTQLLNDRALYTADLAIVTPIKDNTYAAWVTAYNQRCNYVPVGQKGALTEMRLADARDAA